MTKTEVIRICGNYPVDYTKPEIVNNPNFVFKNDPNYLAIRLQDSEDNVIAVNSFIECEHYVLGGWNDGVISEKEMLNLLSLTLVFVLLILIPIKKFWTNFNEN